MLWRTLEYAGRHNIAFLASALTFDALLAALPLVALLLVGIAQLAQVVGGADAVGPAEVFHRLLPLHPSGTADPFAPIEGMLARVTAARSQVSLVAIPTFVWLSMRLFGAVRIALELLFDVPVTAAKPAAQILGWLQGKLRDAAMVGLTVGLFLVNALLTTGVRLLERTGTTQVPGLAFYVSGAGRLLTEIVAIAFAVIPFWLAYRFATSRPLRPRAAWIGALVTAAGFEAAKRLYGAYLGQARTFEMVARGDADILAILLFVFWAYVTATVFLAGGALGRALQETAPRRRHG